MHITFGECLRDLAFVEYVVPVTNDDQSNYCQFYTVLNKNRIFFLLSHSGPVGPFRVFLPSEVDSDGVGAITHMNIHDNVKWQEYTALSDR